MTTRDAIYGRYSSTNQDGGVSIELQLEVCRKLASPKPLEYIDRAVTGRTMQREAFRKMMAAAERGEFSRLVVYKWDRFGRNAETHATIADLEDMGITIISATEGGDFLARGVGLLVSESYSKVLSQRVRDSMRLRFRQNATYLGGTVPYGYRIIKGTDGLSRFEINPDEAAVVRQVFTLSNTESIGTKRIAARLTSEGSKPRKGAQWGWTTINRILRSRIYTGHVTYGKFAEKLDRRTGKTKRIKQDQPLTRQDESLRIISDRDFEKVQKRLKAHTHRDYQLPGVVHPFSKQMTCGVCGSVMFCRKTSPPSGKRVPFLVCGRRDKFGRADARGCTNPTRPQESELVAWVQQGITKTLLQKDLVVKRALEIAEKSLDTNDDRRRKLETGLAKIEQQIVKLGSMVAADLDDDQMRALLSQIGTREKERDVTNLALRNLATEASFDRRALIREIEAAFDEARTSLLPVSSPAVFNRAVERFVGPLVALPSGEVAKRKLLPGPGIEGGEHTGIMEGPLDDTGVLAVRSAFWSYAGKLVLVKPLSSTELAPQYGVAPQTIRRWRAQGKLAG